MGERADPPHALRGGARERVAAGEDYVRGVGTPYALDRLVFGRVEERLQVLDGPRGPWGDDCDEGEQQGRKVATHGDGSEDRSVN